MDAPSQQQYNSATQTAAAAAATTSGTTTIITEEQYPVVVRSDPSLWTSSSSSRPGQGHMAEATRSSADALCSRVPNNDVNMTAGYTAPFSDHDQSSSPVTAGIIPTTVVQHHFILQRVPTKPTVGEDQQPSSLPSPLPSTSSISSLESSKVMDTITTNAAPSADHNFHSRDGAEEPTALERKHWSIDRYYLANNAATATAIANLQSSPTTRARSSMDIQRPNSSAAFAGERRSSLGHTPMTPFAVTSRGGGERGVLWDHPASKSCIQESRQQQYSAPSSSLQSTGDDMSAPYLSCPWVLPPIPDFPDLSLRFDKSRTNSSNKTFQDFKLSSMTPHQPHATSTTKPNQPHQQEILPSSGSSSSSQLPPLPQQQVQENQQQKQHPVPSTVRSPRVGGARSLSQTSMNGSIRINMDSSGWHCSVVEDEDEEEEEDGQMTTMTATVAQSSSSSTAALLVPEPEYLPEIFDQLQSDENEGYILWNTSPAEPPMTPGLPLSTAAVPTSGQQQASPPPNSTSAATSTNADSGSGTCIPTAAGGSSNGTQHEKGISSSTKRWSIGDQFKSKDLSAMATITASESGGKNGGRSAEGAHGLAVQIPSSTSLKLSDHNPPPTPPASSSNNKGSFKGKGAASTGLETSQPLGTPKTADTNTTTAPSTSGGVVEPTGERILMAATVEKLVEKLTSVIDYTFLTDFFLIYRLFITPVALLKLLILRFNWALLEDTPKRQIVRIRTFVTLRHWLLNYFGHDFMKSKQLRKTLASYLNSLPNHPSIASSPRDQRIVKELKKYTQSLKKIHYRNMAQHRLERKTRRATLRRQQKQNAAAVESGSSRRRTRISRAERADLTQSMSTTDDIMPTAAADSSYQGDDRRRAKSERRGISIQQATISIQSPPPLPEQGWVPSPFVVAETDGQGSGAQDTSRPMVEGARSSSGIHDTVSTGRQSRVSEPVTEELSVDFRSSEQEDDYDDEEEDDSELDNTTDNDLEYSSEEDKDDEEDSHMLSDTSFESMEGSDRDEDQEQVSYDEDGDEYEDYDDEDGDEGESPFAPSLTPGNDSAFQHTSPNSIYPPSPIAAISSNRRFEGLGGQDSYSSSRSVSYRARPAIPSFDSSHHQQQHAVNRISTAWSRTMRSGGDRRTTSMALTQDLLVTAATTATTGHSSSFYLLPPSAGSQVSTMESIRSVEPYMNPPPRANVNREKKKTWAHRYMSATVGRLSNKMKRAFTSGSISSGSSSIKNGGGGYGNTSSSSTTSRYRGGGGGSSYKHSITEPATSSASQARLFRQLNYSEDPDNDKVTRTHYFLGSCSAIQFGSSSSSNQFLRSTAAATGGSGQSRQHGLGQGRSANGRHQRMHDGSVWSSDDDYSQYEMTNRSNSIRSASNRGGHYYDESNMDREGSSLHSNNSRAWQQCPDMPNNIYPDPTANDDGYEGDGCIECQQQQHLYQQYPPHAHQHQRHPHHVYNQNESGMVQSTSAPIIVRSDDEIEYHHGQHLHPYGGGSRQGEQYSEGEQERCTHDDSFHSDEDDCQRRHSLDEPSRSLADHEHYLSESGDHVEDVLQQKPISTNGGMMHHRLRRTTRPRDNRRASWRTMSSTTSSMFGALLSEDHRPPGQTVLERMQQQQQDQYSAGTNNIDKFVERLNMGQGLSSLPPSATTSAPSTPQQPERPRDRPTVGSGSGFGASLSDASFGRPAQHSSLPQHGQPENQGETDQAAAMPKPPARRRSSWILDTILMHHRSLSSKGSTETITKASYSNKRNSTPSKLPTAASSPTTPISIGVSGSAIMTKAQKRQTMPIPLLYQHRQHNMFMNVGRSGEGSAEATSRRHSSEVPNVERSRFLPILSLGWHHQPQPQPQQQQSSTSSSSSSSSAKAAATTAPKMVPDTATLRPAAPVAPLTPLHPLPEQLTLQQALSIHPDELKQRSSTSPMLSQHEGPGFQPSALQQQALLRSKPSTPTMSIVPGEQLLQQQQSSSVSTPVQPLKRPTAGQKRSTSQPHLLTQSQLAAAAAAAAGHQQVVPSRHSHHPSMPSPSWHHQGVNQYSYGNNSQYGGGERDPSTPTTPFRREHPLSPITPLYHQPAMITTEHFRHQRYNYQRFDPRVASSQPPWHPPLVPHHQVSAPRQPPLPFVLRYRTELIAQQLCLIERELLNNVQWYELVDAGWTRKSSPPSPSSKVEGTSTTLPSGASRGSSSMRSSSQQPQRRKRQGEARRLPTRSLSSAATSTTTASSLSASNHQTIDDAAKQRYSRTRKRSASEGGVASGSGAGGEEGGGVRMSSVPTEAPTLSIAPIRSRRHPKNPSEESQGIKALIDRFNLTCQWVTTEILNTRDLNERVKVVEKFIRIAQTCYNHSNFSSLIQLILGLQSHNVSRLTKTWARVRPKEILMMQDLIEFTSPLNNWKHLRDTMKNVADEWGGTGTAPAPTVAPQATSSEAAMPSTPSRVENGSGRRTKSNRGFFGMKTGSSASNQAKASSMVDAVPPSTPSNQQDEDRTVKQGGCIPFLGLYLSDLVYNTELPSFVEPRAPPVQLAMSTPAPVASAMPLARPHSTGDVVLGLSNASLAADTTGLPTPLNSPLTKSPPPPPQPAALSPHSAPIHTYANSSPNPASATMTPLENRSVPPSPPQKLINFHKHRTTATIIKRVLTFRTIAARYPFRQEPEVYGQLLAIRGMDASEMERASLLCEERATDAGRNV